jgi:N-acetylneuraminic acid mutarotase
MRKQRIYLACIIWAISGFGSVQAQDIIATKALAQLPQALTNNAVALVKAGEDTTLYSFKGLKPGKTWQDTTLDSFALTLGGKGWRKIPVVPGNQGELAATALVIGAKIYIFGGYAVAENSYETTIAWSYVYDPEKEIYRQMPEIPVAVDDSVSFSIAGRYIYLISGWHNSGNVNLSQVYDTVEKKWFQATPYPGSAVFGHGGAAIGNRFVICDGVEKIVPLRGRHKYQAVRACYKGEVNPEKPQTIKWQRIESHPGEPLYRMAAGGYRGQGDWIIFTGGSDNPYNYDGIGYDKNPSMPTAVTMGYSLDKDKWQMIGHLDQPSMDHRGLLVSEDKFYIIGGMIDGQKVTSSVVQFCLNDKGGVLSDCSEK